MPTTHRKDRPRHRLVALAVVGGLVSAVSPLYLVTPAYAAADGALVINKSAGNDTTTVFPFTVNPGNISVDVTGNSSSAPQSLPAGTDYSIAESVPNGWGFGDAICELDNFGGLTGTTTATGVDGITVESGKTTTCYVDDYPQSADFSLTKTASPKTFSSDGQTISYTVTARNTSAGQLNSVRISDPMFGGDMTNCIDSNGDTTPPFNLDTNQIMTCTATYQTTANDVSAGEIVNTATVRGFANEEDRQVRTATATVRFSKPTPPPPPGSPTLGVTKSSVPASGSTVHRGDQVTYTLAYSNTGTAGASGVTLTDALPADLDYVIGSASNSGSYDAASRTLTWQLGSVAQGTSGALTFAASVAQTATDGEVLHNVGVIAAPGINVASNSDDVTVAVPAPTGTVTIRKSVDKKSAGFGDTLTYSVTVGATGNKDQTHVIATDDVPAGTSYVGGSASCDSPCEASQTEGVVTWNVGTLAAGTSSVGTFQVTVDTPKADKHGGIPAETVSNVARVTFDADPVETSNAVTTTIAAVLGEKATKPPSVAPEPDQLPMTGLPLLQLLMMSSIAIAFGTIANRLGRHRPVTIEAPLPVWRDQ